MYTRPRQDAYGTEVNAGVNLGLTVLCGCLGEACKRPSQAGKRDAARGRKRDIINEKPAQHLGRGAAEDTNGSRYSRESRAYSATMTSSDQRSSHRFRPYPGADRSRRAPEVEVVLCLESSDEPVSHREIDER